MLRILNSILSNKLQLKQLHQLLRIEDAIELVIQVLQRFLVAHIHQCCKRVALAGMVTLPL